MVFDLQALDPTHSQAHRHRSRILTLIVPGIATASRNFTNLIGSIVRYTPKGSRRNRSDAAATPPSIELRDHGPGIDQRLDRGRVFGLFTRADTSRNRKSNGSGLGLLAISGILAAHKGNTSLTK